MTEIPFIVCRTHGKQLWRTSCQFCGKLTSSSTVAPNGAGLAGAYGVPSFYLPRAQFEQFLTWMP